MKKFILLIVVFAAAGFLAYKLLSDKPVHTDDHEDKALRISKNPPAFNMAFDTLLDRYFALHDALVDWDSGKADQAAYALAVKADSLPIRQVKADSAVILTIKSEAATLSGDARGFSTGADIAARRQTFNTITDDLYALILAVHYDQATIYHIRCPMAFKDSIEGYWLSITPQISNPYLGNKHPVYKAKMVTCGEIIDSIGLIKKS